MSTTALQAPMRSVELQLQPNTMSDRIFWYRYLLSAGTGSVKVGGGGFAAGTR